MWRFDIRYDVSPLATLDFNVQIQAPVDGNSCIDIAIFYKDYFRMKIYLGINEVIKP